MEEKGKKECGPDGKTWSIIILGPDKSKWKTQNRVQRDQWFFLLRPRPRLVLISKLCLDQKQYLIMKGQVLNFETKAKSLADKLSSARPLIFYFILTCQVLIFETKTKSLTEHWYKMGQKNI